jgi:RNA polymerase-binding transcription factor DksA
MKKKNMPKRIKSNGSQTSRGNQNNSIQRLLRIDPDAHEVFVAGSFNNWNPCSTPLTNIGHGRWIKELSLAPGRYEYQFVVDGRWLPDRQAEELAFNEFGELNSVVRIPKAPFLLKDLHTAIKPIPRKWHWHYRNLLDMRDRLLRTRHERISEASEPLKAHGINFAESATEQIDHDLALGELSATQETLFEIDQALRRILDGSYGKCELTGNRISAARLRAVPWTRFCAEVETALENEAAISRCQLRQPGSVRNRQFEDQEEQKEEVNDEKMIS